MVLGQINICATCTHLRVCPPHPPRIRFSVAFASLHAWLRLEHLHESYCKKKGRTEVPNIPAGQDVGALGLLKYTHWLFSHRFAHSGGSVSTHTRSRTIIQAMPCSAGPGQEGEWLYKQRAMTSRGDSCAS